MKDIFTDTHFFKKRGAHRKDSVYFLIIKDTPKVFTNLSLTFIPQSKMLNCILYGWVFLLVQRNLRTFIALALHYQLPPLPTPPHTVSTFLCVFSNPPLLSSPHIHWPTVTLMLGNITMLTFQTLLLHHSPFAYQALANPAVCQHLSLPEESEKEPRMRLSSYRYLTASFL